MSKLENQELVEEFYLRVKDKHPGLTIAQCKEVVSTPFMMLKQGMESGELPTVRLKYLGTFVVFTRRVEGLLKSLTDRFKLHKIDKNEYFKIKTLLDNFLKNEKD